MQISELINTEEYLKRFTVRFPDTLFPPNFKALKEQKCPLCGCKIYLMLNGKGYVCRSKKHKRFYITSEVYKKLTK